MSFKFYQILESGQKKQIWLETVEKLASVYGLRAWQLLMPDLPEDTCINRKIIKSNIHLNRRRKGPYYKAPLAVRGGASDSRRGA